MVTFADAIISSSGRPLAVRKRVDLICQQHRFQGRISWVVKEPIGLKYMRLMEAEYFLLDLLNGRNSLDEIVNQFNLRYAPDTLTLSELQQFIGRMHCEGLVSATAMGQGTPLLERKKKKQRSKRIAMLTNLLSIRFSGIDPGWILDALYPATLWFFTRWMFVVNCGVMLAALLLITLKYAVFQARLSGFHEFFGADNWLLMGMVLGSTKILHELGHALACRHYGRECHKIGLLLLVFTPCLYCDVTDSWMLSSKWKRIAISAAGMYVELVLAALATFGWWFSEPGVLNHVCLQIMFVSSVSTLMFNGNPLLRYDGYYILSDLIEIPNLQQKASAILNRLLARWCLGMETPLDPFMPRRHHGLFAFYTIASAIYRWVVLFSILWFLNEVLEPYGLKVLCGAFLIPWPHYAGCPLEVRPRNAASIYVQSPAKLKEVFVRPGEKVEAGQILARCESLDLELKIAELAGKQESYEAQVESLMLRRFAEPEAGETLASIEEALAGVEQQLQQQRHAQSLLDLRATRAGVVLLPPAETRPEQPKGNLPHWQGALLDKRNLGAVVPAGTMFCQIGDQREMEAELYVDQGDLEFVRVGQQVHLQIDSLPGETIQAELTALAKHEVEQAPKSLSNQAGGTLAVRTDSTGVARPLSASYTAQAPLFNVSTQLQTGLRGWARIHVGNQTLASRLGRYLAHTFNFQL